MSNNNKKLTPVQISVTIVILILAIVILHFLGLSDNEDSDSSTEITDYQSTLITTSNDEVSDSESISNNPSYTFKNSYLLNQHYEKHGIEMGFESAKAYEEAASRVVTNPNALHKKEAEDNDDVYYIESSNEFVIVSTEGYIRTYFNPSRGIDYYNSQ